MKLPRKPLKKARIEIIPMIDTMFFLLVFFMIATLTMTNQYKMPVNLPHASGMQDNTQQKVSLTMTKDGNLFYEQERVNTPADVVQLLVRQKSSDKQMAVVINADRSVEHGRVVELMDSIRQIGITKIAIAVNHSGG